MQEIVRQVSQLVLAGHQVAVVSSGAIIAGREALHVKKDERNIPFKQVLAAVGQAKLMQAWDQLFSVHGVTIAQTLLTRADLADRQGYLNARNTLLPLLDRDVVPIINENDVVAVEEIKIGDNDNLSALVANLIDADLLILLTDQPGLYTSDPRRNAAATLIKEVTIITDEIIALAAGAGTTRGTGGMVTKMQAARLATESGVTVLVAGGATENVVVRAANGEAIGTRFPSSRTRLESRKRWILSGLAGPASARIDGGRDGAQAGPLAALPRASWRALRRGDSVDQRTEAGKRSLAASRAMARRISRGSRAAGPRKLNRFSVTTSETKSFIAIMW
jgi:glutamate 5-kinase